jgi:acetyltransferase
MTRLIDIAQQFGIGELGGEILRENGPMLEMCRALGFAIAPDPDDKALIARAICILASPSGTLRG